MKFHAQRMRGSLTLVWGVIDGEIVLCKYIPHRVRNDRLENLNQKCIGIKEATNEMYEAIESVLKPINLGGYNVRNRRGTAPFI